MRALRSWLWGVMTSATMLAVVASGGTAQEIAGRWQGSVTILGQQFPFGVAFSAAGGALAATVDIQGATDIPVQNTSFDGSKVHFELPAGPGLAVWDGVMVGDSIKGAFTQASFSGTFVLARDTKPPVAEEPRPYQEEEVEFTNGDITLAGTLTLPPSPGPHPAAIMITGSGPQNRDEQLFGDYKPFFTIADHLTRNGLAVLRYDDRGIGGSSGTVSASTSADFAADVLAALRFLQTRSDIARDRIGVIGHSEGGLVGPLAAAQSDDVAFVVMLAGPGLTGAEILYAQGELIVRADSGDEAAVRQQRLTQDRIFAALRADTGWGGVEAMVERQVREGIAEMPADRRAAIADVDAFVKQRVAASVETVRTPWFRFFIDYDPLPVLQQVHVPILGVFGEFDLQVPAESNRNAIEAALRAAGHPDYTLRILPGANHLFLATETGSPSEYATMDKTFVPGFLDLITEWVLPRVGVTLQP